MKVNLRLQGFANTVEIHRDSRVSVESVTVVGRVFTVFIMSVEFPQKPQLHHGVSRVSVVESCGSDFHRVSRAVREIICRVFVMSIEFLQSWKSFYIDLWSFHRVSKV